MKVLFVIDKLDYSDHIAIAYLSAIAKESGHLTFFCELRSKELSAMVGEIKPDVVAYSVFYWDAYDNIVAAHREASRKHDFVSIMGGPHITLYPENFAESGADAFCIGEGEYPFRDFLSRVEKGESFDDVDNLITKAGGNPTRNLIEHLGDLPFPDRDLVIGNSFLATTAKKTFYATRGCPFYCAYCCNNYYRKLYKGKGSAVRRFPVERVIREIEAVRSRYRMDFVRFGDDCFATGADHWLKEFAREYRQRVNIPFSCYLRFDAVTDEMLTLLKEAGCRSVILSVDSTSEHIRETILKRKMRTRDIVFNLKKIREHGIFTLVNFMLAAPEASLRDDLEALDLSRKADVTYTAFSTTVPVRKTELFDYCVEKKIIDPATYNGDMGGRSTLGCFSERDKDIRYNIYLLGPIIAKLPSPLYELALKLIQVVPPCKFFQRVQKAFYERMITRKIFSIPEGG